MDESSSLRFSPGVEHILLTAGWYPGRTVDPSAWINQLEREGLRCSPAAEDVLRTLGGIRVEPPEPTGAAIGTEPFDFRPLEVASGESDRFPGWEAKAGTPLFPLGAAYSWCILLMAPDGRVFLGVANEILLVGMTIQEALDVLALGTRQLMPLG